MFDQLDEASRRLLPYLYKKYQSNPDPLIQSIKGYYRHCWYKNQILIHELKGVVGSLHAEGIDTMLTKGMALSSLYYNDLGSRPMNDLDLIVPLEQTPQVFEMIQDMGWVDARTGTRVKGSTRVLSDSRTFKNAKGHELDLHWRVVREALNPAWNQRMWEDRIEIEVSELTCATLHPTDQLIHTLLHGLEWNQVASVRWILDAILILKNERDFDWELCSQKAEQYSISPFLENGMKYLETFDDFILENCKLITSRLSRRYYQLKLKPKEPGDLTHLRIRLLQLRLFYPGTFLEGLMAFVATFSWNWTLKGNKFHAIWALVGQALGFKQHPSTGHGSK